MVVLSINSANIRIEVKQETDEGITLDCFFSQIEEDNVQIVGGPGSNTLKRQVSMLVQVEIYTRCAYLNFQSN